MSDFAAFGDPARFEIAVRWTGDSEPRARLPAAHGWSMGDLRLTVAGHVLTRSRRGDNPQTHVGWYLAPAFDWIASNWAVLFHEEDFAWPERGGAPAVVACHRALDHTIGVRDAEGRARYKVIQAWYYRHALRAASEGGLFPDLFIRRFGDDIELSWSAEPPLFAPDGFGFASEPGMARLTVDEVAGPVWEALQWVAARPPALDGGDVASWRALSVKIEAIPAMSAAALDRAYVDERVLEMVRRSLERIGKLGLIEESVTPDKPYVRELSPAVAMFGGVNPNLGAADVDYLCGLLAERVRDGDSAALRALVEGHRSASLGVPHEDAYAFAEEFLEQMALPGDGEWIDIHTIAGHLGIEIIERALETDSIRGIALAGHDIKPTILVNTTSPFNVTAYGKRFTLAHELCHVLHDRSRARRVTHVSGAWVAPGIERRANAFAAYLLMPRQLLVRGWQDRFATSHAEFTAFAHRLRVNEPALIEHLHNLDFIGEAAREHLRAMFRSH